MPMAKVSEYIQIIIYALTNKDELNSALTSAD
jgi:hypothetical protein